MPRRLVVISMSFLAVAGIATALTVLGQDRPEFTTRSDRAWALYQAGEARLRAFQWAAADSLLSEAVRLDPDFAMAQATLAYNRALWGRKGGVKERIALADSLARNLTRENERMLVQLRLCDVDKKWNAKKDSLLSILVERLPRHPLVIVARANAAMIRGDNEAHESAYRELLDIDPNYASAYNYLGYAAARRGRYEEALSHLRRYAFLAPDLANPHDSLGEVLIWIGDYEAAERELLDAWRKQPDFIASVSNLITVYVAQGRLAKAEELIERTRTELAGTGMDLAFDDHLLGVWFHYGYLERGAQVAARLARKAVAEQWVSRASVMHRVIRLASSGQAAAAQSLCDSLAVAGRDSHSYKSSQTARRRIEAEIHIYQAMAYELLGEPTAAMAEWGRALVEMNREPPHERWWVHWRYGESLLALGQAAGALVQAEQVLSTNASLTGPLLLRTKALSSLGRPEEARQALALADAALSLADPGSPARAVADSLRALLRPSPPV